MPDETLSLRTANLTDSDVILTWRNDPVTRANSLSTDIVTDTEHAQWFSATLERADRCLLMAERGQVRVAVLRLDRDSGARSAEVSINIAPEQRGQRMATPLLTELARYCTEHFDDIDILVATIRPDNVASVHAFEKAGFVRVGGTDDVGYFELRLKKTTR